MAAWEDYQYWQGQDRKTLRRINLLLQDCLRNPHSGLGKPEPLRENLSGYWSRRIDDVNRLIYRNTPEELVIISVRYHY
ncbi:Txe/YoeB family addiction module toxin [Acidithiobacillus concretivorus]|uniref:Putative mRNA interferase YoeB n=1 Tax=Acidithiobacillus concretivorus TaxID=3063952 RepID=A0ABS5ZP20_9PROT|nr:Txe/YoeB family addiction module toxin [Acidithiobacillus concretivorus]MBU2738358.1 Txe/YoeB family addiction module toxin [Acidithiobacillus concretivorus]